VPEGLRPQELSLLEKHQALWSGHLGSIKATEHRIELRPGSKPGRLNPYRMGPQTKKLIKAQVDRMLKLEVIEPSQSEWASPVVLIPKPDGSPRFGIDYGQLNERTVRDSYPLPRTDDCLDTLGDAKFFSTLDGNVGVVLLEPAVGGGRRRRSTRGAADGEGGRRRRRGRARAERGRRDRLGAQVRARGGARLDQTPAAGSEWTRPEGVAGDNRPVATRRLQRVARGTVTPPRLY